MKPYYADDAVTLYLGGTLEVLAALPDCSVDCIVTSPPFFGLRDYGTDPTFWPRIAYAPMVGLDPVVIDAELASLGLENSPSQFVGHLVVICREARRVLADDGTLWLNLGDSYYSGRGNPGRGDVDSKQPARRGWVRPVDRCGVEWATPKNLLGIPWRTAFALQADGWILRNDDIWAKPNPMPEPVTDRCTASHEHLFMFAKNRKYHFDAAAIAEPATGRASGNAFRRQERISKGGLDGAHEWAGGDTRNRRDVWTISAEPFPEAHFATFPSALAQQCLLAGSRPNGVVLDIFSGSGTTGLAATRNGRRYVGIDLNPEYLDLSLRTRLAQTALLEASADV